jgi:hypothetical protein
MGTDLTPLPTELGFSFPNLIQPLETEIGIVSNYVGAVSNGVVSYIDARLDTGVLITNVLKENLNFSIVSQDFRNTYAYLLGGTQQLYSGYTTNYVTRTNIINTITNVYVDEEYVLTPSGAVTNSSDGSQAGAALVPVLQYNQEITKTNFVYVNTNTHYTARALLTLAAALGATNDAVGIFGDTHFNLVQEIAEFKQMNTEYVDLPTNLVYNTPNLLLDLEDDILGEVGDEINERTQPTDGLFIPVYTENSGQDAIVSFTNKYQYLDVQNNVTIYFESPPSSKNYDLYLWVKGNTNYTISYDTSFVLLDTNAVDLSNTNITALYRYYNNPFSSIWYEKYVSPDVLTAPPPPPTPVTITASGGTETVNTDNYKVHTFNSDGNFDVTAAPEGATIEVLLVGGGGGGGSYIGGGGGGGGFRTYTLSITNGSYGVVVGAGGGQASAGSASSISVLGTTYSAPGGGAGGGQSTATSGGCGGGGGSSQDAYSAGKSGSIGGSGGNGAWQAGAGGGGKLNGASATQRRGGNGGTGFDTKFRTGSAGSTEYFAGGGGGGSRDSGDTGESVGSGGAGGGGRGGWNDGNDADGQQAGNGTANTGGGGGGGGYPGTNSSGNGGSGGSGVVIIKYPAS